MGARESKKHSITPAVVSDNMKGLSLLSAAVFIVGEMAGSGILALPAAVAGTGWFGIILIAACCLSAGFAAVCLGRCWLIVEERYPEYRSNVREPFCIIGLRAVGHRTKSFVTLNIILQLFGVAVVFLLIASELIHSVLNNSTLIPNVTVCDWIVILGLALIPFMWFGSPQDFSPIAFAASATTAISCVLIAVLFVQESLSGQLPKVEHEVINADPKAVFLSIGTIIFAYGGAATFPTFQNDMRDKTKFPAAVALGFLSKFFKLNLLELLIS